LFYNAEIMSAPTDRRHLLAVTLDEFSDVCQAGELPAFRARQVFEWVYGKGVCDFASMSNLSKSLRQQLSEQWAIETASEIRRQVAKDGTIKLLLGWPDGATSECVLIPDGKRQTACISSQVGCPVRCAFCASGHAGLQRQLTTGQIVEQVIRIRALAESPRSAGPPASEPGGVEKRGRVQRAGGRLSNIVFMGLGEPLANYDAVTKAIRILNADWGLNIGARSITVSTVGLPDKIRRLADERLQINLAISLHAPNEALRRKLIPWARRVPIEQLIAAGRYYFEKTGREVTLEYLLLADLNDQPEHANQLVKVCRKMRCNVNLIRYNPVPGLEFERPTSFAAHKFVERLRARGLNAHIRKSRGLDIGAACGQLRRSTTRSAAGKPDRSPRSEPPKHKATKRKRL